MVTDDLLLEEMLERWESSQRQLSARELCQDHPALDKR